MSHAVAHANTAIPRTADGTCCLGTDGPDGWELVMLQELWILMVLMRDVCR